MSSGTSSGASGAYPTLPSDGHAALCVREQQSLYVPFWARLFSRTPLSCQRHLGDEYADYVDCLGSVVLSINKSHTHAIAYACSARRTGRRLRPHGAMVSVAVIEWYAPRIDLTCRERERVLYTSTTLVTDSQYAAAVLMQLSQLVWRCSFVHGPRR